MADDDDDADGGAPTGSAAVGKVASTTNPGLEVTANALAFFMGDEPAPGENDRIRMLIDFGGPERPDFRWCVFRPLENEQFVKAAEAAMVPEKDGGGKRIDPFTNWSVAFAYACIDPDLGAILTARRERGDLDVTGEPFADTAAIVRSVFRKRSGALRAVMDKLEAESRMQEDTSKLVRQIEAGKGSR